MKATKDFDMGHELDTESTGQTLELEYENEAETVRVDRLWRMLSEETVREVSREKLYDYDTGGWNTTHEIVRDYDIDENGRLVGDGSNWSGEGVYWKEYARDRHVTLLRKRFPYDDVDGRVTIEPVTDGGTDIDDGCPNEPERRNQYGEPICDDCGMVVVDRTNSDFGGGCLCRGCQTAYRRELDREFGSKTLATDGGVVRDTTTPTEQMTDEEIENRSELRYYTRSTTDVEYNGNGSYKLTTSEGYLGDASIRCVQELGYDITTISFDGDCIIVRKER